jgi:transcriptional regulator with XRE-family HTH domain
VPEDILVARRTPEALFGLELKRVRERLGTTQEELADRAGLHVTYVSQLERGLKSPSLRTLLRLAESLDRPASRFIAMVEKELSPVRRKR